MSDIPTTMAVRFLREHGVSYEPHVFRWEKKGAKASAEVLGVDPAIVVKTLIFETEKKAPLVVLMDGTHEVSTKGLARALGVKLVVPCDPKRAEQLTGYQVGGISPFGQRTAMPIYIEEGVLDLPLVYVNGGKRGFLISLPPEEIRRALNATPVSVAV